MAALTDAPEYVKAFSDAANDHMLAVALRCRRESQEKLGGVAVLAGVCHGYHPRSVVLQLQAGLLVIELAPIDGIATCK